MGRVIFVSGRENRPLSGRVIEFLKLKGFDLARWDGAALNSKKTCAGGIGILHKDPKAEPLRGLLGSVWFNDQDRKANERNWVFEVYGRNNVGLAWQLAEDMVSAFNVDITLLLEDENVRFEMVPE